MALKYPSDWKFDTDGIVIPSKLRAEIHEMVKRIANGTDDQQQIVETFKSRFGDDNTSTSLSWAYTDLMSAMEKMENGAEFAEALWLALEDVRAKNHVAPTLSVVNKLFAKHGFPYVIDPPNLRRLEHPSPAPASPASTLTGWSPAQPPPAAATLATPPSAPGLMYDVALSFAGEDRAAAEAIASLCKASNITVFYDHYETADLWGKDLYQHLAEVYANKARFCVVFVSHHYAAKLWTNHELKAAQSRAFRERQEYILPLRMDAAELPGIMGTTGYVNWSSTTPDQIVRMIEVKLGRLGLLSVDWTPAGGGPNAVPPSKPPKSPVGRFAMPRNGIHSPPYLSSAWWIHVDGGEDLLVRAHGHATGDSYLGTFKAGTIRATTGGWEWKAILPPGDHVLGANVVTDLTYAKGRILDVLEDHIPGFKSFLAATGTPVM